MNGEKDMMVDLDVQELSRKTGLSVSQIQSNWSVAAERARRIGQAWNTDIIVGIIKDMLAIQESGNPYHRALNKIYLSNRDKFKSIDEVIHEARHGDLSEVVSGDVGETPENVIDGNDPKESDEEKKKKKEEALAKELGLSFSEEKDGPKDIDDDEKEGAEDDKKDDKKDEKEKKEESRLNEDYKYYLSELRKLLPINEYGAQLQVTSSNGKTKWMNLNRQLVTALMDIVDIIERG
jgi:hypothetical protein